MKSKPYNNRNQLIFNSRIHEILMMLNCSIYLNVLRFATFRQPLTFHHAKKIFTVIINFLIFKKTQIFVVSVTLS